MAKRLPLFDSILTILGSKWGYLEILSIKNIEKMSFSDHFAVPFTRSTNALNSHFPASPPSLGVKWDEMTMMISSMERGELTAV